MTDTPRTDAAYLSGCYALHASSEEGQFARHLERELAEAQARIAKLETINKKVAHCGKCGDTWYDSGIASAECPYCRIAELERDAFHNGELFMALNANDVFAYASSIDKAREGK